MANARAKGANWGASPQSHHTDSRLSLGSSLTSRTRSFAASPESDRRGLNRTAAVRRQDGRRGVLSEARCRRFAAPHLRFPGPQASRVMSRGLQLRRQCQAVMIE